MKHANLDTIRTNIIQHYLHLLGYEWRGNTVYPKHPLSILRCQSCNGRHGVTAEGCNSFNVCLYASASTGV
jgi:hypothetical protein